MNGMRGAWRHYWVAIRAMIVLTVALGIVYPLVLTGIGQVAFPAQANGSLISENGTTVGSALIGQGFTDKKGNALAEWFQSRPSAAGDGYDGAASSGSNLGPNNPELLKAVKERTAAVAKDDGIAVADVPIDAVTASGSGLDPHISPAYALDQVQRVAHARGLSVAAVRALVESKIQGRDLGYLGEPTVNVLQLNIALAKMDE
ncbi:potassium-transporting ATPase subunit KdpC [Leifsonia sp. PS1209]|uniref:potassium-transporting ATPase subunit KdpC n=1 Tax=Leifsonia sp. PS1209 TaxID=2724914 RepID=UPI001442ADD8|nr:potassium-transporting ATPase subunit KdpC [Leifsonia sp. PS1209]QIZ99047.1 potassium-transporting ATPase subunit KdpC [Leifsonia sp. PS1209]